MNLEPTLSRPRILAVVLLPALALACWGPAHYMNPPDAALTEGSGPRPVKSDKLEVRSANYPTFRASRTFQPPPARDCVGRVFDCHEAVETAPIEPGDEWRVSHVLGDRWIIQSAAYNRRQCEFLVEEAASAQGIAQKASGRCLLDREFGIYVDREGKVVAGWQTLPSSRLLFGQRKIYFIPDPDRAVAWEPVEFRPVND